MLPPSKRLTPIRQLLEVMAALRSPQGCPWDREQDHQTLRYHAVEEVYELLDAIEASDDHEMAEELGDLLLQVVFHAQLASERRAFDFDALTQRLVDKLIRRHPHVFGEVKVKDVDQVWANWEQIKRSEKAGSRHERKSALDGIPTELPALMKAQKLIKKARKAGLPTTTTGSPRAALPTTPGELGRHLFELARLCQDRDWNAEDLLRSEIRMQERAWRKAEAKPPAAESRTPRRAKSTAARKRA